MTETVITVRSLARELGLPRIKVKDWCKNHKPRLGRAEGKGGMARNIVLQPAEAAIVRRELAGRLDLPEPADIEAQTGQKVYAIIEAAKEIGMERHTVAKYVDMLGIGIQIRNGVAPSFVVKSEDLATIVIAAAEAKERITKMLQDQAKGAAQIGGRRAQHAALMREERDYETGRPRAWLIGPQRCDALSSELPGGPETKTFQWLPFLAPEKCDESIDTSVWKVSDHRQHLSLDTMLAEGQQI